MGEVYNEPGVCALNLNELLLFFVPGFPLVLSIPLLHKVIPRTEYLAILPAVVFLILPENIFVETPLVTVWLGSW